MGSFFSLVTRSGVGRALRHKIFAIYIAAHTASVIGLWIQRIAIQWLAWSLTGSYAWLGAVALAEALANMIFSIASGPLADRFDRVKLANITQGLLLIVATSLALVAYLDLITIPILTAFVIITGILEGIWAPVRLTLMPNMVPKEDMSAAVAMTSMMFTAAIFVGPAIGGVIIAFADVEGAFLANGLSYLGLLLVFLTLKIPRQAQRENNTSNFLHDLLEGFSVIINNKGLRTAVLFGFGFSLFIRPYRELFAGIADEFFRLGAEGLAAMASAAGFGALVGALGIAVYGRTAGITKALYVTAFVSVLALVVFAHSQSFVLSLAMAALLSTMVTIFGTGAQMLIQVSVADSIRGRVMSVWQAQFRGVPAIGAWLIGLVETRWGLPWVLTGAAMLFFVVLGQLLLWRKDFASLET